MNIETDTGPILGENRSIDSGGYTGSCGGWLAYDFARSKWVFRDVSRKMKFLCEAFVFYFIFEEIRERERTRE